MKLKEAVAKIEELEKRIAQLEQRPVYVPYQVQQFPFWEVPYPPHIVYQGPTCTELT